MTEETIIAEAPKRDFYFSFADEAEADTALQPFYHQPEEGDAYLVKHSKDHSIDIITNPGARYEAEGNAGIIGIREIQPGLPSSKWFGTCNPSECG